MTPEVFTTILMRNATPQFLAEHVARLRSHAAHLSLPCPCAKVIEDLILATSNHASCCLIRISVSEDRVKATARPLKPPLLIQYLEGVKILMTEISIQTKYAQIKSGYRKPYEEAKKLADTSEAFEALLIDEHGFIVDGTRSSPMLFCDDTLISIEGGIPGIVREQVLKSARKRGILVERRRFKPHELNGTLLLAGSGIGLVAEQKIDDPRIRFLIRDFQLS